MQKLFCAKIGEDVYLVTEVDATLAEKDVIINEVNEEAGKVRLVLLLNHGHKGQYLDDGKMQCGECGFKDYDFKKPSLSELTKRIVFSLNEQIATLKVDRDTAISMLEDAEARVKRQAKEIQRYREALEKIDQTLTGSNCSYCRRVHDILHGALKGGEVKGCPVKQ